MTENIELVDVVRREVSEALDEFLSLTESYTEREITAQKFVRDAFRIFHNTKGALHLGGFSGPERVAHAIEDRLSELRKSEAEPETALVDLMEQAMCACVYSVEGDGDHPELELVRQKLEKQDKTDSAPATDVPLSAAPVVAPVDEPRGPNLHDTIRVEAIRLDRLMDLGSEYLAQHTRLHRQALRLRELADGLTALAKKNGKTGDPLVKIAAEFELFVRGEELDFRRTTQLTADFDRAMRQVRMQPLSGIVPQMRRVVTETARGLGKNAHLNTDFGEVELDREVLDGLREPLLHLLRNAIDHGIESPKERTQAKKAERGEVSVEARVAGANVELIVSDDGRGIDANLVRKRAESTETELRGRALSDEELIDTALFAPGFSTAAQVTTYSGRGVGLDIVRSRVAQLGGTVFVTRNEANRGVSFTISVPASVVSLRGLSVAAGGQTFVLPNSHVERTIRVGSAQLSSAEGVTIMQDASGEPLRLRWLATEMQRPREEDPGTLQVVVLSDVSQRIGLVVEEVQGDTTYVIKRLPWNLRKVPGVIGATHQGGSSLALVVDPGYLIRRPASAGVEHRLKIAPRQEKLRILVADDSLTSRTLERNILLEAGYEVRVEEDGQKALTALEQADFDLLVSDVQMPHMDGIALTKAVRAHPRLARLPIILVTSLDSPEDVARGAEAGADEYIVKGQFDQGALLSAVSRLL